MGVLKQENWCKDLLAESPDHGLRPFPGRLVDKDSSACRWPRSAAGVDLHRRPGRRQPHARSAAGESSGRSTHPPGRHPWRQGLLVESESVTAAVAKNRGSHLRTATNSTACISSLWPPPTVTSPSAPHSPLARRPSWALSAWTSRVASTTSPPPEASATNRQRPSAATRRVVTRLPRAQTVPIPISKRQTPLLCTYQLRKSGQMREEVLSHRIVP